MQYTQAVRFNEKSYFLHFSVYINKTTITQKSYR